MPEKRITKLVRKPAGPPVVTAVASNLSKVTPPTLHRIHSSQRLFARLDFAAARPIIWIHGAPGAGKTTLAASYVAARGIAPLWLRLDAGDYDPASVFFYLAEAAKRLGTENRLPLLTPEFRPALPLFTRRFFRDLFTEPGVCAVVFDDYHEVAAGALLHDCLPHGLEEIPSGRHVVIVSRTPPPASFARLRLNGLVEVIEPDALRMTPEEAGAVARARGVDAGDARIERITRQTQGWAAGVILMLEAGVDEACPAERGDFALPEVLFDYFVGEIFQRMEPNAQRLLCMLALMPTMTVAMAERLSGSADAGLLLEDLRKRNYFTSRDTAAEPRYRFHPLFRDFLLSSAHGHLSDVDLTALQILAATILDDQGEPDPAVGLLTTAGAVDALATLVKRRASTLLAEGRNDTLVAWLRKLPSSLIEQDAWLSYWSGAAVVSTNPRAAMPRLRCAFDLFRSEADVTGQFLAWAGQAEAVRVDPLGDHKRYDSLIDELHALLVRHPDIPSAGVMLPVAIGIATALSRRGDDRAEIILWQNRARVAAREISSRGQFELVAFLFAITDLHDANFAAARCALDALPDPLGLDHQPMVQISGLVAHAMAMVERHEVGDCVAYVEEALRRIEATGFRLWCHLMAGFVVHDAYRRCDIATSGIWLRRMGAYADRVVPNRGAQYHTVAAQHYILSGDLPAAKTHADTAVAIAVEVGWHSFEVRARLVRAEILVASGALDEAKAELDRLDGVIARSATQSFAVAAALLRADWCFVKSENDVGMATLAAAMALARRQDLRRIILSTARLARLCSRALRAGIEPDYILSLISVSEIPSPNAYDEVWPWPIRITTLGAFAVMKNDAPLAFSRKTPKRLITLLKAMVAYGGRDVSEEKLIDSVWPDDDGDSGHSALTAAIHRLRKLLGDPSVIVVSGAAVSLDPTRCWLDIWTVEDLFASSAKPSCESVSRSCCERLLALYRGDFLVGDDDMPWTAPRRLHLRRRFASAIRSRAEGLGHAEASALLERAIEAAPVAEELYQGLMQSCFARGEAIQGIEAYGRLCKVLDGAGTRPAPASEALYKKLLSRRMVPNP